MKLFFLIAWAYLRAHARSLIRFEMVYTEHHKDPGQIFFRMDKVATCTGSIFKDTLKITKQFYPLILISLLCGCALRNNVVSSTSTIIGVEIAQNPQTQMYQAKLGYNRQESAIVPTDKSDTNGGADKVANVLMEVRYSSIFSLSDAGIYQRLAVGAEAVRQPGAALMFAKDKSGSLSPGTAEAITRSVAAIPAPDNKVTSQKLPMAKAYGESSRKAEFDTIAAELGFPTFGDFLASPNVPAETVAQILVRLKVKGLM